MSASKVILEGKALIKELGEGAGKVIALKGVDLRLKTGEMTLLMGPSGSGKTTLLSIVGCILKPTSGTLELGGVTVTGQSAEGLAKLRREQIGFIFQSYNLFPTLTAEENVLLALDVRRKFDRSARDQARDLLDLVGLTKRMKAYPRNMSGGERQRVAIARALVGGPSIILADEPTAALDSTNGQAIMALLAQVAKDTSRAVFVVTHDARIISYANRIIKIEDGLIVGDEWRGKTASQQKVRTR
jgi:putative ABC transport system ATP-binding protein